LEALLPAVTPVAIGFNILGVPEALRVASELIEKNPTVYGFFPDTSGVP
jgi:hypothetical protein